MVVSPKRWVTVTGNASASGPDESDLAAGVPAAGSSRAELVHPETDSAARPPLTAMRNPRRPRPDGLSPEEGAEKVDRWLMVLVLLPELKSG
jgi:hypothetical protein